MPPLRLFCKVEWNGSASLTTLVESLASLGISTSNNLAQSELINLQPSRYFLISDSTLVRTFFRGISKRLPGTIVPSLANEASTCEERLTSFSDRTTPAFIKAIRSVGVK